MALYIYARDKGTSLPPRSERETPDVVEGAARRRVPAAAQEDAPVRERVERRGDARRRAGDVKLLPRALGAVHRQEPGLGRRLEACAQINQ